MAASPRTTPLRLSLMLGALALTGAACSFGSGGDSSTSEPQLGEVSGQDGLTAFAQSLAAEDDLGELVPGFANMWDLDQDFSIATGGLPQNAGATPFDGALEMRIDATDFPGDQSYDALTFRTPEFGTADGLVAGIVYDGSISGIAVDDGTYSLAMAPMQSARLTQTLDLTSAGTPLTLQFDSVLIAAESEFSTELSWVDVTIKDTSNTVLQPILSIDSDGNTTGAAAADISALAGRIVRLSIEARSTPHSIFLFDDFTVFDGDLNEYVTNGGFETGSFAGWSRNTPSFVRNVTSEVRTVESLEVTRSFYAAPSERWGRMVDVFTNPTGATIDETVTYFVNLGSNGEGIIYDTPNTMGMAVTSWDSREDSTRDVGWAFGGADAVTYLSDDTLGASGNGGAVITVEFGISVPPGGSVALANFLVLDTDGTGNDAADVNATADRVDAELEAIVAGWPTDGTVNAYTSGLTQAQIDAVVNF